MVWDQVSIRVKQDTSVCTRVHQAATALPPSIRVEVLEDSIALQPRRQRAARFWQAGVALQRAKPHPKRSGPQQLQSLQQQPEGLVAGHHGTW